MPDQTVSETVDQLLAAANKAARLLELLEKENDAALSSATGTLPDGTPVDATPTRRWAIRDKCSAVLNTPRGEV